MEIVELIKDREMTKIKKNMFCVLRFTKYFW